jgi:hypothetical protein
MGLPERAYPTEEHAPTEQPGRTERRDPPAASRMRRSATDLEQEFAREISRERHRRASLRRTTEQRMRKRAVERRHKRGSVRFVLLVLTLFLTAAIVTVAMFRTLYLLLS